MKYLKPYRKQSNLCNESIRHLLKNNKTEDDIRKNMIKTYTPQGKKVMAAKHDLVWLLDETIKECDLDSNRDLGYIFNIAVDYNSINTINYLIKHWNLKFQPHNLYSVIDKNNFELMKLIFDSGHIDNIDIDKCIKYTDDTNILLYLYSKKNINESIKHLLKPKSKEDILKSIKNKSNTEKYLISLINDMDWLYNMTKDYVKTIQISIEEFNRLSHSSYLLFNIGEKEKINNNINYYLKGKRSYYTYDYTYSLYINHTNGWKINNYDKYILISVNLRNDNHVYYLCPNIDELINLLNKYNIKARQYDPIEKQFIDV